ncbi:MAG: DUF2182 domain-containing protein [Wenzhouxiangella sp.]
MQLEKGLEALLRRDRAIVVMLLVGVFLLCWAYLLAGAGMDMSAMEMTRMASMDMPAMDPVAWSPGYATVVFFMWWIMMVAMMLPSATPMILLFATINRRQREQAGAWVPTSVFTLSYIVAWGGFSLAATVLHGIMAAGGLLRPDMALDSTLLGAALLIAAGLYQLTPFKRACLRHCRMPAQYLALHYRPGLRGALVLGFGHGAYCLGCCWVLMALLFVGGVMNLYWIAGLALYVLVEKTLPMGHWLGHLLGLVLIVAGTWLVIA